MSLIDDYKSTYRGLGVDVWKLSAVTFVYRSGTMVLPFLALYATQELGTSAARAGGVLSLYGIGSVLGAWVGGRLSDGLGPLRAQTLSLITAGLCLIALQWIHDPTWFALAMVPTALAAESFRPSSSAALASFARPENRSRVFALRRLAINAGMTIGPAFGGVLAAIDYKWLFRVDGLTCLVAAIFLWAAFPGDRFSEPTAIDESPERIASRGPSAWTDRPYLLLLLLVSLSATVFLQVMSTWPLTLRDVHGLDEPRIGLFWATNTILIVLFEMPLVGASERRSPLLVAAAGMVFVGIGLGGLPWTSGPGLVFVTVVFWTVGEMLTFPALESLAAGRAPASRRGQYLGLFTGCFSVAFLIGPLAGTWIYQNLGPTTLWVAAGIGSALCAGGLVILDRRGHLREERPAANAVP